MDKWDKLLEYVIKEEDKYYDLAIKEMYKGNMAGNQIMTAQASAFQRVRYAMETIGESNE